MPDLMGVRLAVGGERLGERESGQMVAIVPPPPGQVIFPSILPSNIAIKYSDQIFRSNFMIK